MPQGIFILFFFNLHRNIVIGHGHKNVIFVLLWMTDCFQVTYSTTREEKGCGAAYNLLRAERWRTDCPVNYHYSTQLTEVHSHILYLPWIYLSSFHPIIFSTSYPACIREGKKKLNNVASVLPNADTRPAASHMEHTSSGRYGRVSLIGEIRVVLF